MSRLERLLEEAAYLEKRRTRIRNLISKIQLGRDLETRAEEQVRIDALLESRHSDVGSVEDELDRVEEQISILRKAEPGARRVSEVEGRSLTAFLSYAHEDAPLASALRTQLAALDRAELVRAWHDGMISPGTEWNENIKQELSTADLVLLLVSSDFLASNYVWNTEVKEAMLRHDANDAVVIPIILRPCHWTDAPFAKLQALPAGAKPVTCWTSTEEALADVTERLGRLAKSMLGVGAEPS